MTTETEWRAFNRQPLSQHQWAVEVYTPAGRKRTFENLDEPTARLIAAAPAKAALCEELADALSKLAYAVEPHLDVGYTTESFFVEPLKGAITALRKAGRAPQ